MKADPHELQDLSEKPAHQDDLARLTSLLIDEMYGGDREWVRDEQLVGLPDREYTPTDHRGLLGQRGWRFM
jgi:hypothetical protein